MSAPSAERVARWLRRGATALAGAAFDALVDSLELGKRTLEWLSHSASARAIAVAALALVVAGGAAWAVGQRRAATVAGESARPSEQAASGELGDAP